MTEHLFTQEGHLTDLTLERLELDDLSPVELEAAHAHLEACEACRQDLEARRDDNARYFDTAPATWRPPRPSFWNWSQPMMNWLQKHGFYPEISDMYSLVSVLM